MGSRGAFVDITNNNYSFVEGGQIYTTIYYDKENNIKYLKQTKGSIKVPDYSHAGDRIYAVIQKGKVKSIGIYKNHIKVASIDLFHSHMINGIKVMPHVHTDLFHNENARLLTKPEMDLVELIKKEVKKIK